MIAFVICNVINQILAQDDANGVGHAKGMCATVLRFSFHLDQSRSKQLQESSFSNLSLIIFKGCF